MYCKTQKHIQMKKLGMLFGILILSASILYAQTVKEIFIHPHKVACTGVAPTTCMQYRYTNNEAWKLMYGNIIGFTHEEGKSYTLKIKENKLKNVPADGSSIQRVLVKIVASKSVSFIDMKSVNQQWNISKLLIDGSLQDVQSFAYTLQLKDSALSAKICNNFNGTVHISDEGNFKALPMRSTKMMCIQINHESSFVSAIQSSTSIQVQDGKLQLLDENKTIVLEAVLPAASGPVPPAFTDFGAILDQTKYNVAFLQDGQEKKDVLASKAFMQFDIVNKRVSGKGGCNNFFAHVEVAFTSTNAGNIKFSKAGSTMMACPNYMDTERKFLQLLEIADNFEMNESTLLLKQGGSVLITLQAVK
jgi:heat shock protein HslJ